MNNSKQLLDLALKAQKQAYAPYSNFAVGAAILSDNNNFYFGCNVENVSYPEGSCAETAAIAAMVADGDTLIKEILIIGSDQNLISPCGGCLQRIKEFSDDKTLIHLASSDGIKKTYTIKQMLPIAFESLK